VDIETPSHKGEEINKFIDLVEKSIQALACWAATAAAIS
jgi:hypothetical protein